jgi:hypothetical protein
MELSEQSVLKRNPELAWRKYLKSVVIDPGVALNETAAIVFERMDGTRTLGAICVEIMGEFEIDRATCVNDTLALVRDLIEQGFVVPT